MNIVYANEHKNNKMSNMANNKNLSRREFMKLGGLTMAGFGFNVWDRGIGQSVHRDESPEGDHRMARVAHLVPINVRAQPNLNSALVGTLKEDSVVPWLREVIGYHPHQICQRWVETTLGYVWSPFFQPVYNKPNQPVVALKETSLGQGMWVEVTVPYVDMRLENPQPFAPSPKHRIETGQYPRLYYSQVVWVDQINVDSEGQTWYRINERYSYGDVFWGPAEAFRLIEEDEVTPIALGVENKRVDVNLARQSLSCYENDREVYYCRVSTGAFGEDTETPPGNNSFIFRKMISMHMSGGTSGGGWDLPGVGYTSLFRQGGIAIHSTFWHNNFGERTSAGCVNVRPEDAKWIFRWSTPVVGYDPGDSTVTDFSGTNIRVLED